MIPRGKIDLSFQDALVGLGGFFHGIRSTNNDCAKEMNLCCGEGIIGLSVRSGFHLMLSQLNLPRGSEVLVSDINIPHMFRILEHHGLVTKSMPLDPHTLAPDLKQAQRLLNEKTRAVLVTHLFGGVIPLESWVDFCNKHQLYLWEDCAQAWAGNDFYTGHPGCQASFFSFGFIKTRTCLGGAWWVIRSAPLKEKMLQTLRLWPRQSSWVYLKKYFQALAVSILLHPFFSRWNLESIQHTLTRGFKGTSFIDQFEKRPCRALLNFVRFRLSQPFGHDIEKRIKNAQHYLQGILEQERIGDMCQKHSHWVLPIRPKNPVERMAQLHQQGLLASRRASTIVNLETEESGLRTEDLIYLPMPAVLV